MADEEETNNGNGCDSTPADKGWQGSYKSAIEARKKARSLVLRREDALKKGLGETVLKIRRDAGLEDDAALNELLRDVDTAEACKPYVRELFRRVFDKEAKEAEEAAAKKAAEEAENADEAVPRTVASEPHAQAEPSGYVQQYSDYSEYDQDVPEMI